MQLLCPKLNFKKRKKLSKCFKRTFKKSPKMQKKIDPLPGFLQYSYPIVKKKQKNPQTAYHVCLSASKFGDGCQKIKGQRCLYLKVLFSHVKLGNNIEQHMYSLDVTKIIENIFWTSLPRIPITTHTSHYMPDAVMMDLFSERVKCSAS